MRGAGGTGGGIGRFFLGLAMLTGGTYLLLSSMVVTHRFSLGFTVFRAGPVPVSSGILLLLFMVGVGIIFYNAKNFIGWLLAFGALIALIVGVIASLQVRMQRMSLFTLLGILILMVGGLGLFLSSLRNLEQR